MNPPVVVRLRSPCYGEQPPRPFVPGFDWTIEDSTVPCRSRSSGRGRSGYGDLSGVARERLWRGARCTGGANGAVARGCGNWGNRVADAGVDWTCVLCPFSRNNITPWLVQHQFHVNRVEQKIRPKFDRVRIKWTRILIFCCFKRLYILARLEAL